MVTRLLLTLVVLFSVSVWGLPFHWHSAQLAEAQDAPPDAPPEKKKNEEDYYELYRMLADTIDQVEQNYVKPIDRRELIEAAVQGIVSRLDPYSSYISPDEISQFRSGIESEFGGIGIRVALDQGELKVVSPLVDTPAYRAGIRAGDHIIEIEGKSTEGMLLEEAVRRLKGVVGTSVTITLLHPNNPRPEKIKLDRQVIHVATVLGNRRNADDSWNFWLDKKGGIAYLRISAFSRETAKELGQVLTELKKQNLQGLIVDLRFNPGGLLKSAVEISDMFVASGCIVSTEGRNTERRVWEARQEGDFETIPLAVLVNRYSASASEILAGCLQDHKRALIIGERTWGKGSVQNVIELEGGKSALKLTTASYLRPSGKNIHRFPDNDEWGVNPDSGCKVFFTETEMNDLMRHQRDSDSVRSQRFREGAPPEPEEDSENPFVDRQLQRGIEQLVLSLKQPADGTEKK